MRASERSASDNAVNDGCSREVTSRQRNKLANTVPYMTCPWRVSGLRGTGSHDFSLDDVFVPEQRAITGFGGTPTQPGRLYGLPFTIFSVSLVGVPLGLARAAIDTLTELARNKSPMDSKQLLKDKPAIQAAIGRAEATLRAARAFLFEAVQAMWDAAETSEPSLEQRALVRLSITHVAAAAKQVTEMMFEAGGGTALHEDGRLARCSRDAQAAAPRLRTSPRSPLSMSGD